jgi:DNA-binding CsgD family transcriptional regulator
MPSLPPELLQALVDRLTVAVFVFRRRRVVYVNAAAEMLTRRLRSTYRIELEVVLRHHLESLGADQFRSVDQHVQAKQQPTVTLMTTTTGEPFYVHVVPLEFGQSTVGVTVRSVGSEIDAIRRRYELSAREAQVAELVLHGYKNLDIANSLGITLATTKKHLTRIFDKVGVNSRSQLQTRLA